VVLVVIASEHGARLARVGVPSVFDLPWPQRVQQPPAVEHIGIGAKAHGTVKPEGELTGEIKPQRHLLLLARTGIVGRQLLEHSLTQEQSKELGLLHGSYDLHIVEVAVVEGLGHKGLIELERVPTHGLFGPFLLDRRDGAWAWAAIRV